MCGVCNSRAVGKSTNFKYKDDIFLRFEHWRKKKKG